MWKQEETQRLRAGTGGKKQVPLPHVWLLTHHLEAIAPSTYSYMLSLPPLLVSLMSISATANYLEGVQGSTQHDCGCKHHWFMEGTLIWEAKYMGNILAGSLTRGVNDGPSNSLSSEVGRILPA